MSIRNSNDSKINYRKYIIANRHSSIRTMPTAELIQSPPTGNRGKQRNANGINFQGSHARKCHFESLYWNFDSARSRRWHWGLNDSLIHEKYWFRLSAQNRLWAAGENGLFDTVVPIRTMTSQREVNFQKCGRLGMTYQKMVFVKIWSCRVVLPPPRLHPTPIELSIIISSTSKSIFTSKTLPPPFPFFQPSLIRHRS